jgi:hypothetical protein
MKLNLKNPSLPVGLAVLIVGVILLVFTFTSAYGFLTRDFTAGESDSLTQLFGSALMPIIEACIHAIYLGIMGWIGAILTSRGIRLMVDSRTQDKQVAQPAASTS